MIYNASNYIIYTVNITVVNSQVNATVDQRFP